MIKIILAGAVSKNPNPPILFGADTKTGLPWPHCPQDMKKFVELTNDNVVVMGRKTYEGMPIQSLKNRGCEIVVITTNPVDEQHTYSDLSENTLKSIESTWPDKDICLIGGLKTINQFVSDVPRGKDIELHITTFLVDSDVHQEWNKKTHTYIDFINIHTRLLEPCGGAYWIVDRDVLREWEDGYSVHYAVTRYETKTDEELREYETVS